MAMSNRYAKHKIVFQGEAYLLEREVLAFGAGTGRSEHQHL